MTTHVKLTPNAVEAKQKGLISYFTSFEDNVKWYYHYLKKKKKTIQKGSNSLN